MAKPGDIVRYLNATGGGKITRIDGNIAYVEENGFETPVLIKELVVVMPTNHNSTDIQKHSGQMIFDQAAYDAGRKLSKQETQELTKDITPKQTTSIATSIEETAHGNKLNVALIFEPIDYHQLLSTNFTAILVNDSNYYLAFSFATHNGNHKGWKSLLSSIAEPNMELELGTFETNNLSEFERISFQCVAFKQERCYERKNPINLIKKLDLSKFYKAHCFRPGVYSNNPVIEIMLIKDDEPTESIKIDTETIREAMSGNSIDKDIYRQLSEKYNRDSSKIHKPRNNKHVSPTKLLPLIEVDLHIGELTDTISGISNSDILGIQLDTVRRTMEENIRRNGQKIIFIHGKGEGVLRKAVIDLLHKYYPKVEIQDASFREYGFGATLVTIH